MLHVVNALAAFPLNEGVTLEKHAEAMCNPYDCSPSSEPIGTSFEDDDAVIPKDEFFASLARGEQAYREGMCVRMRDDETVKELLERVRG